MSLNRWQIQIEDLGHEKQNIDVVRILFSKVYAVARGSFTTFAPIRNPRWDIGRLSQGDQAKARMLKLRLFVIICRANLVNAVARGRE